jgi:hypothetical protein
MQRRAFIAGLGGTAIVWSLAARAQQSSRMKRIAIVSPATKIGEMGVNGFWGYRVFFEELSRLGYVEGQNLVVERYSGEGRTEHYADLARDVVNTHPDLIFSQTTRLALNFKAATTTIPIVTTTAERSHPKRYLGATCMLEVAMSHSVCAPYGYHRRKIFIWIIFHGLSVDCGTRPSRL